MKKVILLLFACFTLAGCAAIPANNTIRVLPAATSTVAVSLATTTVTTTANTTSSEVVYYQVVSVVDGDTIKANINGKTETIRLIGIDTPETVDPRKIVQCFGKEASNKAKEWLSGKMVELEADASQGERDKYDRLLRYVRVKDGIFYNLEIIKQGYANEYTYNLPYKYQSEFKAAEKYAQDNKLGLWSATTCSGNTTQPAATTQTVEPTVAPLITPTIAPTPTPTPDPKSVCNCSGNIYNCDDFSTHAEAQALYECCGGVTNDVHGLDRDKDGSACDTLP